MRGKLLRRNPKIARMLEINRARAEEARTLSIRLEEEIKKSETQEVRM